MIDFQPVRSPQICQECQKTFASFISPLEKCEDHEYSEEE